MFHLKFADLFILIYQTKTLFCCFILWLLLILVYELGKPLSHQLRFHYWHMQVQMTLPDPQILTWVARDCQEFRHAEQLSRSIKGSHTDRICQVLYHWKLLYSHYSSLESEKGTVTLQGCTFKKADKQNKRIERTLFSCPFGKNPKTRPWVLQILRGQAVLLYAMEALGERRYSSYSFLTSALNGGEWSASRPGRALGPRKEPPVPIVQDAGWAPEPVWT
jgi:hypothetical protein